MKLLKIVKGNAIPEDKIIGIYNTNMRATKRLIESAKEKNMCSDMCAGRKAKTVIQLISGHVILTGLTSDTIFLRLEKDNINNTDMLNIG